MHTDYRKSKKSELCLGGEWFNPGCENHLGLVFFPQCRTFMQIMPVPSNIIIKLSFAFQFTHVISASEAESLKNKGTNSYESPVTYTPMSLNRRSLLPAG